MGDVLGKYDTLSQIPCRTVYFIAPYDAVRGRVTIFTAK